MEKPFVLLADDNEATCTLITALLQKDFSVDIAGNGAEAIEWLKKRRYAVIVLDLAMPVVDGYAVLDEILAQWPALMKRVLILTATVGARELQRVKQYDIHGIVNKPFDIEALLYSVKRCAGAGGSGLHAPIVSSSMLLLLADFLHHRWL